MAIQGNLRTQIHTGVLSICSTPGFSVKEDHLWITIRFAPLFFLTPRETKVGLLISSNIASKIQVELIEDTTGIKCNLD